MGAPYADIALRRDHQGVGLIMPVTNVIESLHMQLRKIIRVEVTSRTMMQQSS
jgi:hypothetical protein